MESIARAYVFSPYLKSVIWGGGRLPALKGVGEVRAIGESWELSPMEGHVSVVSDGPEAGTDLNALALRHGALLLGDRVYAKHGAMFPLLVKFIDARQSLSVQVHPGDEQGKTEMWYVIDHEPDAEIYTGLSRQLTDDDFDRLAADGSIMDAVHSFPSRRGDAFFIPPGTVHSIGAGNFLLEVQQPSDLTYRIYDFGRLDSEGRERELHIGHARRAIDFAASPAGPIAYDRDSDHSEIVSCEFFTVRKIEVDGTRMIEPADGSFTIAACVGGECQLSIDGEANAAALSLGHTALIPACASRIEATGRATLILINA